MKIMASWGTGTDGTSSTRTRAGRDVGGSLKTIANAKWQVYLKAQAAITSAYTLHDCIMARRVRFAG